MSFGVPYFPLLPMTNVLTSFPLAIFKISSAALPTECIVRAVRISNDSALPLYSWSSCLLDFFSSLNRKRLSSWNWWAWHFIVDVHPINAYSNNLLSFPHHKTYIWFLNRGSDSISYNIFSSYFLQLWFRTIIVFVVRSRCTCLLLTSYIHNWRMK